MKITNLTAKNSTLINNSKICKELWITFKKKKILKFLNCMVQTIQLKIFTNRNRQTNFSNKSKLTFLSQKIVKMISILLINSKPKYKLLWMKSPRISIWKNFKAIKIMPSSSLCAQKSLNSIKCQLTSNRSWIKFISQLWDNICCQKNCNKLRMKFKMVSSLGNSKKIGILQRKNSDNGSRISKKDINTSHHGSLQLFSLFLFGYLVCFTQMAFQDQFFKTIQDRPKNPLISSNLNFMWNHPITKNRLIKNPMKVAIFLDFFQKIFSSM